MWIALSLLSALGAAGTSLLLKRAVDRGPALTSTVAFRLAGGVVLAAVTTASGAWVAPSPAYWRTVAMVMPPEIGGMLCLSLALRTGDLSQVQPMFGLLPLFVALGGALFLGEVPTPAAAAGIALVTGGVYCVGLRPGGSPFEPLRALARSPAGWYALAGSVCWSITTVLHKFGIAAVGPLAWGTTLAVGPGLLLAAALPFAARGAPLLPRRERAPWATSAALAGVAFALQQVGLQIALRAAQAGYVIAVASVSTLLATTFGVLLLRERGAAGHRLLGGLLVSGGAVLIALGG